MPHVVSFIVTLIAFLGMRIITRGGAVAVADDVAIRFTLFYRIYGQIGCMIISLVLQLGICEEIVLGYTVRVDSLPHRKWK